MATSRNTAARFGVAASLLLIAAHVASRPIRDALFLSNFPVTVLPRVTIAAALVTLLCATLISRLLSRFPPGRLVPAVSLFSALLFIGEWWLLGVAPGAGAIALYLHLAGFTAILVSGLWSVVNERFDPHSGKQIFARIGGFGALGGVLGGVAAFLIAPRIGAPTMLLGFAGLHVAAGLSVLGIGQASDARPFERAEGDAASGLRILRASPLLLRMAALVALLGIIEELVDYAFKAEASFQYQDEASLVEFFAIFYTAASAIAFLLQSAIGGAVLSRLGLGGAMALLPAGVALMGSAAAVWTRLWTIAIARATNAVLAVSFFRAGFELLYTPLPPETKRPTKAYIDVGGDSVGKMVGGAVILSLLFLLPSVPVELVLGIAVVACIAAIGLIARLQRGYVTQLAENLRSGAVSIEGTRPSMRPPPGPSPTRG
jgi:ATP/ADP translocase